MFDALTTWMGGGAKSVSARNRFRPTLTALDERAVPDGTAGDPPVGEPPVQPPTVGQTDTVYAGDWLYVTGEGDDAAWMTVGEDGGVWFVTGGWTAPQFEFLKQSFVTSADGTQRAGFRLSAPVGVTDAGQPDDPLPPGGRPIPPPGGLMPPAVPPPPVRPAPSPSPITIGNWQIIFNADGTTTIRSTVTQQSITFNQDGTATLNIPGRPPILLPKTTASGV